MESFGGSIWSAAILLFFLMDPLGNIPILLSVLKGVEPKRQRRIILREVFFALIILLIFLFAGKPLLEFLHLQVPTPPHEPHRFVKTKVALLTGLLAV